MPPLRPKFSILCLLLATAGCTTPQQENAVGPSTAAALPPAAGTATEDQRLLAFLDRVFDETVALSPEALTGLGIKQRYGELDNYTDAERVRRRELADDDPERHAGACTGRASRPLQSRAALSTMTSSTAYSAAVR